MNVFDQFKRITHYDLQQYFADYESFLVSMLPSLVAYYKGYASIDSTVFAELDRLNKETATIEALISSLNQSLSSTTEFWDLIDNLSIIQTKLNSIENLAKWLRSSYVKGYENQSRFKMILKQDQTLENAAIELGSANAQLDWVELAVSNGILELDYTRAGGNVMDVKRNNNRLLNVSSVVDIMIGDNILGKDLPRKIEFIDDDSLALDTVETMEQSADICLRTVRGSVPEFMTTGISKNLIGSPVGALRMFSLTREVINNFRTDDSFKSVSLIDSKVDQDTASYEFRIESRLHNEINKTL